MADNQTYVFYRDDIFYMVELSDDDAAKKHAELKPGISRIEDAAGRVVWAIEGSK